MLGRGIIVGSVGVLVRPIAKGLNSSISKAFAGSSGAARKAGQQAGKAFADPVAAEGEKLPGRAFGPLRSRASSEAGSAGDSAGSSFISRVVSGIGGAAGTIASTLGRVLKGGAIVGGTAALAGLGYTLTKGFGRLSSIENAESKLTGLGNSAKDVESIMDNALNSVKGTSYGMDEAATTAASAVAAGIAPGKELEKYLGLVGDAAAIAGTDMGSMGSIFNKVATSGKVQGDVFAQLGDQGIPIVQLLAEQMGVSAEEVYKLGSEGAISSEMFLEAMSSMEGAALDAGNTTTGALKNTGAAISRLGATLLEGIYPMIGQIARRFTELVDVVQEKVAPIITALVERFGGSATAGIDSFFDTLIGWVENFNPEPMINFFERIAGVAKTAFAEIKGGITAFGAAWEYNDGEITSSGFPGFMERAGYLVRQLWDAFKQLDFSSFGSFFESLSSSLGNIGGSDALSGVGSSLSQIAAASPTLLASAISVLGSAMEFLAKHADTIVKFLPLIVGGFLAWNAATKVFNAQARSQMMLTAAMTPLSLANNSARIIATQTELYAARATRTATAATNGQAAATTRATIATRIKTIAEKAGAIASKAAAIATRLLGAAIRFATGPIGLIITGITLLVGALVWFFTQTEVGKELWTRIWGAIKGAAAAVVDWFTGTALPLLQSAWQGIAAGALWLYQNAILPAWNGIQTAIAAVGNWITGTLWPALQAAWTAIGTAAMWLYTNVIQPVWTGIKTAIAIAITAVMVYIDLLTWYFQNVIAPVALWLYNSVIKPAWAGIQAAIGAVVSWVQNTAWPMLKTAWNAIAAAARWLYSSVILPVWNAIRGAIEAVVNWVMNVGWPALKLTINAIANGFKWLYNNVIKPVWNAIRTAISAVVSWLQNTAWPLISTVIGWLKTSFNGWKLLAQAVWSAIQTAINAVVAWFRDTAWPLISSVIGSIKSAFNTMRDSLKNAWSFIKDKVISPVVNWFRDTVGPIFDTVTDGIKSAFNVMKDAVEAAWKAIRDTAKVPVEFVVNKIINDAIIGNYNDVAKTFGLDGIDPVSLPSGWKRGGILPGYTPMSQGDDVLTPMRSGEGVLVSEGLRDRASQKLFLGANAAAKAGMSFARFMAQGYAGGGLVKLRNPFAGSYPQGEGFGARGGKHKGIDWPMPSGAILKAVAAGTVSHTRNAAAGNKLELAIGNGLVAGYHHLSSFIAGKGASVGRGADVARVGSTGRSSGPHLHFSLKKDGTYVNPAPYLGAGGEAGSGGGGWNPFSGLWESLKEKVRDGVGDSAWGNMLFEMPKKMIDGALTWVSDKITGLGDWAGDQIDTAGGYARWSPVATDALMREGQFGPKRFAALMKRMNQESSFNPNAQNNTDINAKNGIPSKGLMQVIPPTFATYRDKTLGNNIWDPLQNIVASIRYTLARYGDLERGWGRSGGYSEGGIVGSSTLYDSGGVLPPGLTNVLNASGKPEAVLTNDQLKQLRIIASGRSTGTGDTIVNNVTATSDKARELVSELNWSQKVQANRRGRYATAGR